MLRRSHKLSFVRVDMFMSHLRCSRFINGNCVVMLYGNSSLAYYGSFSVSSSFLVLIFTNATASLRSLSFAMRVAWREA